MFLELFSKLHGIYITFFQQTLEPWWETTSRVLLPVGLPGGTKNTPVGHAGAEAQSNYFWRKKHCLLSKSYRGTTGTTKSENKRGECQSDGIGWMNSCIMASVASGVWYRVGYFRRSLSELDWVFFISMIPNVIVNFDFNMNLRLQIFTPVVAYAFCRWQWFAPQMGF